MNHIDDLIAQHCPDGVEFKRLGDIVRIKNGKDHKLLGYGEFPVYGSGGVMRYADTYAYNKPSVLIPRKGSLGNLFFVDSPFWNVDTIFYTEIDEAHIRPKFLYYFLTTVGLGEMNQAGGVPSQTQSVLNELKIPVPPLEVQREIVKVLDTFTRLEAELEAELEARRRQYKYYRDALLTFDMRTNAEASKQASKQARLTTLGDVATYANLRISSTGLDAGSYVGVDNLLPDMRGKATSNYVPTSGTVIGYEVADILIGNIRPYLKKIWLADSAGGTNQDVLVVRIKAEEQSSISPRFLYHLLASDQFFAYDMQYAKGVKMPRGDKAAIMQYEILIPPPEEQSHIVSILDKFDTLTNSLSEGLPREIALRQQQYEYYRDLLLSFPKAEEVMA